MFATLLIAAACLVVLPGLYLVGRRGALGGVFLPLVLFWDKGKRSLDLAARTDIGRYLADQPEPARAYLVSKDFTHADREFEFLAPGYLVADLTPEQVSGDIERAGDPTLLILTREQEPLLAQLQALYPGGVLESHAGNAPGEVAFYSFELP